MRFWDSSAIVPSLVEQPNTKLILQRLGEDKSIIVSWMTYFECFSALSRLEREGLEVNDFDRAAELLDQLSSGWTTIRQTDTLAREIKRVLRVHPLKCADAIQLGSALIARNALSDKLEFCCLDAQLNLAARKEGLVVIQVG
jgi:predicted nucleic acid-binding protein